MLVDSRFWLGIPMLGIIAMRRFLLSRQVGRDGKNQSPAIAILQARYARGEIKRDEYMEKQRDLSASTAP